MMDTLVGNRFRTHRRLGSGSFGEIFVGVDQISGGKVAMKFERQNLRCPQLRHEFKVYRELKGCKGICNVTHYGTHLTYNVMVLELLGPSLEELFTRCGRKFSLKTTLKLADQMLERVETLHSRHLIHRDIKPANFVMAADSSSMVYCIDFGLSKRYRNPHTLQHISFRTGKSLTGTPRYASVNNHQGIEQSRRDDLEAVGYVLVYFLKGRLPWQGLKAKSAHRKYKLILEKKMEIPILALCRDCPPQFAEYLTYCRNLSFDKDPDIFYLRGLFRGLYKASGYENIQAQDWDWLPARQHRSSSAAAAAPPVISTVMQAHSNYNNTANNNGAHHQNSSAVPPAAITSNNVFIDASHSDSNARAAAMGYTSSGQAIGSSEHIGPTTTAALPSGSADARIASTTASPLPTNASQQIQPNTGGSTMAQNNNSSLQPYFPPSTQSGQPQSIPGGGQQQQLRQPVPLDIPDHQAPSSAQPIITTQASNDRQISSNTNQRETNQVSRQSSTSQRITGGKRGAPASFAGSERAGRRPSIEGSRSGGGAPAPPAETRDPYERSGGGRYELRRPRSAVNYRDDARASPSAGTQKGTKKWATKTGVRTTTSARDINRTAAPASATNDPRVVASARGVMSMARNTSVSSRSRRGAP